MPGTPHAPAPTRAVLARPARCSRRWPAAACLATAVLLVLAATPGPTAVAASTVPGADHRAWLAGSSPLHAGTVARDQARPVGGRPGGDARDEAGGTLDPAVVLPVPGPVLRFFVRPPQRWSAGHRGIDLAAAEGEPVASPVSGVVEFAGPVAGRTVITVLRPDGLRASLEPLDDVVPVGTAVTAGGVVGRVGSAAAGGGHCGAASCVHWGVRRGEEYVDPLSLLGTSPAVLLP